jgi:hypothetical protein
MKKVLVVHYSQTGQLTDIVTSILGPLASDKTFQIDTLTLQPQPDYPFPWSTQTFCDVFPESVEGVPCDLAPIEIDPDADYDLIILAYTVWYLSPSLPVQAFLGSPEAARLFQDTPVVTVIGCRNMWLLAQEKVKRRLKQMGAQIAGNIVLTDRASNLVGVLTIAVWMLTGKKERFLKIFPRPGISNQDIKAAGRFGEVILKAMGGDGFKLAQTDLNARGAVRVDPALLIMEKRVSKIFNIWSEYIRKKGHAGDPRRSRRVRAFMVYLIAAVIVLAPLAALLASVLKIVLKEKIAHEVEYYSQNNLKESA